MSKILFVDDEISRNIDTLPLLFGQFLSEPEKTGLRRIARQPMGTNLTDIHRVLRENPVLEIEDTYAGAIRRVLNAGKGGEYDLFVIDRNLSTGHGMYGIDEIVRLLPGYDKNAMERYQGREGDLLLLLLYLQGAPCGRKFYFYSAYQADDIRSALYLGHMIGFNTFARDNFIDKADPAAKEHFRDDVLAHLDRALIVAEYRDAFNGLRWSGLGSERDRLIDLLRDDDTAPGVDARVLLELFRAALVNAQNAGVRQFFTCNPPPVGLEDSLNFKELQSGTGPLDVPPVIFGHCQSIKRYVNEYVAHTPPENFIPTSYTWSAVRNQLLELFTWLGQVLQ